METGNGLNLTQEERTRMQQAVEAAERLTSAEIVPMIVRRSGLYRDARYLAGLTAAAAMLTTLVTVEVAWLPWGWHAANAAWLLLATLIGYGVGHWLGRFAPVIRLFTSTDRMHHKVRLRAERAFAQHSLSRTRDRNGLLIMLSLLEHQVCVLADQPLFEQVPGEVWDHIVAEVVTPVRAGDFIGGLCRGIERAGTILAQFCPPRPGDNPNELSDQLIQEP
ncbi:MAG TPA: TPM domain-containing protein [Nitrospiraceae bacterium]|nr:TPM domain-containing protein [Nitrospiraceae bacterium]